MAPGIEWSEDMCWTVIRMSVTHTPSEIRSCTLVSERAQRRMHKFLREYGNPAGKGRPTLPRGRPRSLAAHEALVSLDFL